KHLEKARKLRILAESQAQSGVRQWRERSAGTRHPNILAREIQPIESGAICEGYTGIRRCDRVLRVSAGLPGRGRKEIGCNELPSRELKPPALTVLSDMPSEVAGVDFVGIIELIDRVLLERELSRARTIKQLPVVINVLQHRTVVANGGIERESIGKNP